MKICITRMFVWYWKFTNSATLPLNIQYILHEENKFVENPQTRGKIITQNDEAQLISTFESLIFHFRT
jgi:hypothetical protein